MTNFFEIAVHAYSFKKYVNMQRDSNLGCNVLMAKFRNLGSGKKFVVVVVIRVLPCTAEVC